MLLFFESIQQTNNLYRSKQKEKRKPTEIVTNYFYRPGIFMGKHFSLVIPNLHNIQNILICVK